MPLPTEPDQGDPCDTNSSTTRPHGSNLVREVFAVFAESFQARADLIAHWFRLPALTVWLSRRLAKPPALIAAEFFVALALSVTFFQFVAASSLPHPDGNVMQIQTFGYLGDRADPKGKDTILLAWKKRLAGPALSSWLLDKAYRETGQTREKEQISYQTIFGFYHAGWLFLLFLLLILCRRDALFIMLGVFAGLMYNLTDYKHGWCYYPWDISNMFFFTLACLLYDQRKIWPFLAACVTGYQFKETSLLCAVLIFFYQDWSWPKRVGGFVGAVLLSFGINHLMMVHYGVTAPLLAMDDTGSLYNHLFHNAAPENLAYLFSLELHHVLFSNAGALLIILLVPWRNYREVTFKTLLVVFVVCEFAFGLVMESRIWYEILPLSWMLVSEAMTGVFSLNPPVASVNSRQRGVLLGSYWLMLASLLVVAIAIHSYSPFSLASPALPEAALPGVQHPVNDQDLAQRCEELGSNYVASEVKLALVLKHEGHEAESASHLWKAIAVETNAVAANNLAWLLTTATDARVRNGSEAVSLAESACRETHYKNPLMIATLAAALAEARRPDDAAAAAEQAQEVARAGGQADFAARMAQLAELYKSGQTYR
jgi:hypothetical protein